MPAGTAAFWMLSLMLALTPGADWAYAISAGLRYRSVVPAVGGLLLGHLAATVVVAAGVAALLARSPAGDVRIDHAGAGYLVWLGISTLARPSTPRAGPNRPAGRGCVRRSKGAGISGLNPKVFLLFLALLPQFIDPLRWPSAQIMLLGLVHAATCAVSTRASAPAPARCWVPGRPRPGRSPASPAPR